MSSPLREIGVAEEEIMSETAKYPKALGFGAVLGYLAVSDMISSSATPISRKGDDISHLSHSVFKI